MDRRHFVFSIPLVIVAPRALAHHGWGSFDESRPLYLEGTVKSVKWQNPHAELVLEVDKDAKAPADLASRAVPAQSASVQSADVLSKVTLPNRKDTTWTIELAPLTRMQAWKVAEVKAGEKLAVVGYAFPNEKGEAVLRVEYLLRGGTVTPLRSSPA